MVVSGGDHVVDQTIAASGALNEGDDTAANPEQAENVDIASTVAWIYGLDPATVLPDASGRALTEAFSGVPVDVIPPHANRAIIFIFDGNNSVRVHEMLADCARQPNGELACGNSANVPIAAVRSLILRDTDARLDLPQGTLTAFGSMAAFPTVTFPNHNVVGSGVYPGHHGIVGNRYYERDIETERDPIDPTDPRNPLFFFSSALLRLDFETLHEAVHRGFGDWAPAPEDPMCDPQTQPCNGPSGAFTASVNEPSARGADFASLETTSSENFPATFAFLTANSADFVADTNVPCGQQNPDGYGQESILDHLGQAQARALYSEPSTSGAPAVPGVDQLTIDETGGAAHPDPKYLIENFTLTDGAGHTYGPHGNCARQSYGETSKRFARVVGELANHGRFATEGEPARLGETFIVLTGDHGMENQNLAGKDFVNGVFFGELNDADIEFIWQDRNVYLLTLHAELVGPYSPGEQTVKLRITDGDVNQGGGRQPVGGASVQAENGAETQSGTTDANGEVTLTFAQPVGTELIVRADNDASPSTGTRTTGSTSPDPIQHGTLVKTDFNDLVAIVPLGSTPPSTPTMTPLPTATPTSPVSTPTPTGPSLCGAAPVAGCRTPAVPGKGLLSIRDRTPDSKDRLIWKWLRGAVTTKAEFGSPTTTTGYELCIYDASAALISSSRAPADGTCRNGPCWRENSRGFKYRDPDLTPDGLTHVVLREGLEAGKAKILVKGKGESLQMPPLPLAQPVRVQLRNSNGSCWEAQYSAPPRKNDAQSFKDTAD